jgi:hypothetical protein
VWKIIGGIKMEMGESFEEVKEIKLKEIRAIMNIGWENEIKTCENVEKALIELI